MAQVLYNNDPTITDTVLIRFTTTDANGTPIMPYQITNLTIYFIERNFVTGDTQQFNATDPTTGETLQYSYSSASPVQILGTSDYIAWNSLNTADSQIVNLPHDDSGNSQTGVFQYAWMPSFAREGDYFVCFSWIPTLLAQPLSDFLIFRLISNTTSTTVIPSHETNPNKYTTLLDRYLPEMFKITISDNDLTPDVLNRFNNAVAKLFTDMENMSNQIIDLLDANVVNQALLQYISHIFNLKLRSNNVALWRQQIKQAIPLYKQKGTLPGLIQALNLAGITLNKLIRYFQVVSSTTWRESFVVNNSNSFVLAKNPVIENSIDSINFNLTVRRNGTTTYTPYPIDYVQFTTSMGITTMTWIGNLAPYGPVILNNGDIVNITYKYAPVINQPLEDYIRTLPLADLRDEAIVTYPPKNWNVKLITEDDPLFDLVCPTRQPYRQAIVFGSVRTEFAYSENIYNMEEWNGGNYPSTNPCDIDKDYSDDCSCCYSSYFSLDVSIDQLSDARISELYSIIQDNVPFHFTLYSVNLTGTFEDIQISPVENINVLINNNPSDTLMTGELEFNRSSQLNDPSLTRDMLASSTNIVTRFDGIGHNTAITLYSPVTNFEPFFSGLNINNNLLEILTGVNTGNYGVTNARGSQIDIVQYLNVPMPLNTGEFIFRLSNYLYAEAATTIVPDNQFVFTDPNVNFAFFNPQTQQNSSTPWHITINNTNYTILQLNPDNSLIISGWTGSTTTNISYALNTYNGTLVTNSSTGTITVNIRGKITTFANIESDIGIKIGDYVYYDNIPYLISDFISNNVAHITGWNNGSIVGFANVQFYRRIMDNKRGFFNYTGMRLETTVNHYNALGVQTALDDSNRIENYLILIDGNYYTIASWSDIPNNNGNYDIILNGVPILNWTVPGT